MDTFSRLVTALRTLPGVGPKSAQRMVYHLLNHHRDRGLHLASCLQEAMLTIRHCDRCNNHTTEPLCELCSNPRRNSKLLCVVENPSDVNAIEQTQSFKGNYYVLMGKISPMDGIGPDDIGLPKLRERVETEAIQEIILALNPTVESYTTIHFIQELFRNHNVRISQLAQGVPTGYELEFLDCNTIESALRNRLHLNPTASSSAHQATASTEP